MGLILNWSSRSQEMSMCIYIGAKYDVRVLIFRTPLAETFRISSDEKVRIWKIQIFPYFTVCLFEKYKSSPILQCAYLKNTNL